MPDWRIVLIGLPGSGKSTIGKGLAKNLGLPFVDSDSVIEQRIGCSIRAFFETQGEIAFRDVEEIVIEQLTADPNSCVLATGGGAVLRQVNRERLRRGAHVVYLRAVPEELLARLRNDRKRPLLQVEDPLARLKALYDQRDPLYRETAHTIIDSGSQNAQAVVKRLLDQLKQLGVLPPGK